MQKILVGRCSRSELSFGHNHHESVRLPGLMVLNRYRINEAEKQTIRPFGYAIQRMNMNPVQISIYDAQHYKRRTIAYMRSLEQTITGAVFLVINSLLLSLYILGDLPMLRYQ